jgi:hypothetical protein
MKSIFTKILIVTLITSCSKAEVPNVPKDISIHIRQDWILSVTESGIVSLRSMLDSDPRSRVHTSAGAVNYEELKQDILKQAIIPPAESSNNEKSVSVTIQGEGDKRSITDSTLLKILSQASRKWEFPGLNKRLLEQLNRKPILKNIEEQNKALHPTEGSVVPK